MNHALRTLAAAAVILAMAGISPAARPCCQAVTPGSPAAEIAPAPCCGTGCASLASAGSPEFVLAAESSIPAPAPAAAVSGAGPFLLATSLRPSPAAIARNELAPPRGLFILHSQLLI